MVIFLRVILQQKKLLLGKESTFLPCPTLEVQCVLEYSVQWPFLGNWYGKLCECMKKKEILGHKLLLQSFKGS